MKQLYHKLILSCLFLLIGTTAFAYDYCIDGIYYNLNETEKTASVTFFDRYHRSYSGNVIIPTTIKRWGTTYDVTSIGNNAFSDCSGLTSVTIPSSVTSIDYSAFSSCSGLTAVNIPEGVTSIGSYAFYRCSGLTAVTIPNSVTSIDSDAFYGCSGLKSVSITDLTSWCKISFGTNTSNPLNYAHHLYMDGEEVTNLTIPNSVTSIGSYAFYGCSGLTSVTIPSSVKYIGNSAFSGCSGLTSVNISENVTYIGEGAFRDCSGLTSVSITDLTSWCKISFGATNTSNPLNYAHHLYMDGEEVTNLTIPNSITTITRWAFKGCSGLTSVTIPESVTSIDGSAFSDCSGLMTIQVDEGNTIYDSRDNCNAIIETSSNRLIAGCMNTTIPSSVTTIGGWAFYGCSGLTSVTIPESVTSIGGSFSGCSGLTSVTINSNDLVSKEYSSTSNLGSIFGSQVTKYYLGEDVMSIGRSAFESCYASTIIELPDHISEIGASALGKATAVVKKGTVSMLALWKAGYTPVEKDTGETLESPYLELLETTQTTATWKLHTPYTEYSYRFDGKDIKDGEVVTIANEGLLPDRYYTYPLDVYSGDNHVDLRYGFQTKPMDVSIITSSTASSIHLKGVYAEGDAIVTSELMRLKRTTVNRIVYTKDEDYEGNTIDWTGLGSASITYEFEYVIKVDNRATYTGVATVTKPELVLKTLQPRVISSGNVIVAAESNLDDEEVNVGFEWRRTDWDDQFDSRAGGAYLYEGTMEGYIRDLNAEKLWKFRPYYKSDSGVYYYGEWVGLDPSDTSYFDPTVHTYAKISVEGNQAQVKGYVMRGSDKVVEQGFKYWKVETATTKVRTEESTERAEALALAVSVPGNALTATGTGEVMEVALTGLEYNSEYAYVAFVTTAEGDTFYGEERTFITGEDITGIEDIDVERNVPAQPVLQGIYTLQGVKVGDDTSILKTLPRGIYLVNGKKVMVK